MREHIKKTQQNYCGEELFLRLSEMVFSNDLSMDVIKPIVKAFKGSEIKFKKIKIALLFCRTGDYLKKYLELYFLAHRYEVEVYMSSFSTSFQDIMTPDSELYEFKPDFIFVGTHYRDFEILNQNIYEGGTDHFYQQNIDYLTSIWKHLKENSKAVIIQNDIDIPENDPWGLYRYQSAQSITKYYEKLNQFIYSTQEVGLIIHPYHALAQSLGKRKWFQPDYYHRAKIHPSPDCLGDVAKQLTQLIVNQKEGAKKCLILDLDGVMWGGIVGDDGEDHVKIGQGDPVSEAHSDFQQYIVRLKEKGVMLAVCSKNEEHIAKSVFKNRSEMQVSLDDILCFKANWSDKATNIKEIAIELNIGLQSCVFVDDTKTECEWVSANLPEVSVVHLDRENPGSYVEVLSSRNFFDSLMLSDEDKNRNAYYIQNKERDKQSEGMSLTDFLKSLKMKLRLFPVNEAKLERVVQLTNKSNQFNLCTKRVTEEMMRERMNSKDWIVLCAELTDKFGDNGLISVWSVFLDRKNNKAIIDNGLMSCRVLKRGVEMACMNQIVSYARDFKFDKIEGQYIESQKNALVKDLYKVLSFEEVEVDSYILNVKEFSDLEHEIQELIVE